MNVASRCSGLHLEGVPGLEAANYLDSPVGIVDQHVVVGDKGVVPDLAAVEDAAVVVVAVCDHSVAAVLGNTH